MLSVIYRKQYITNYSNLENIAK